MENIKRVDFTTGISNSDGELINGTKMDVCILWNATVVSDEEVLELINSGMYEYDNRLIVTTPKRADNLRGN